MFYYIRKIKNSGGEQKANGKKEKKEKEKIIPKPVF